jgi:hypothetical protein
MEFQNSFYIIEHDNKLEIMSHEKLMAMDKNTYQLIQNFQNHSEAVTEMLRLVHEGQSALHDRIDKFL